MSEDLDELHALALRVTIDWRSTVEPLCTVRWQFVEAEMLRMGHALTEPYDHHRAAAVARHRALFERSDLAATIRALGEEHAFWTAWHEDRLDGLATGW